MLLRFATAAFAAVTLLVAGMPAAHAQYTTRIEPRPFYGATITLEEGVRVIRPLPPERHVIINPDNATPLSLGFHETRVYENRVIRNYHYHSGGGASGSGTTTSRAGYYVPGYHVGRSGLGRYGAHHAGSHGYKHGHGGGHR